MEKVYIVEYEGKQACDTPVKSILGVFDTSERAIAYLRKAFKHYSNEQEHLYVIDEWINVREYGDGRIEGKMFRAYDSNLYCMDYEEISFREMTLNAAFNPTDDMTNAWS